MNGVRAAAVTLGIALTLAAPSAARAQSTPSAEKALSRSVQEAHFLRLMDRQNTASRVTADLSRYTGSRVAYVCAVDGIVRPGIILGQCGPDAEPMDLFLKLPTQHLRLGERLRFLGVMEEPATWADVTGHTVYFAFVRAIFVDPIRLRCAPNTPLARGARRDLKLIRNDINHVARLGANVRRASGSGVARARRESAEHAGKSSRRRTFATLLVRRGLCCTNHGGSPDGVPWVRAHRCEKFRWVDACTE
jgi:hypothetical protein